MNRLNFLASLGAMIAAPFVAVKVLGRKPLSMTDCSKSTQFTGRTIGKRCYDQDNIYIGIAGENFSAGDALTLKDGALFRYPSYTPGRPK